MAMLNRSARYFLLAIAATVLHAGVGAEGVSRSQSSSKGIPKSEPIISIDQVIRPPSSTDGDYPIQTYGPYGGRFFWMDNQKLILGVEDEDRRTTVIEGWNVDSGSTIRYGFGKIMCYADGLISKMNYGDGSSRTIPGILQKGLLGQEIDFVFDKSIHVYDHSFECGDQPSVFTTSYVKEHPDEIVIALRKEHGLIVRAKRSMFPDGRTNQIFDQDQMVLHRPGKEPKSIPVPSKNVVVAAYYPFVDAYVLFNSVAGFRNIYVLLANGEVETIKPPEGMSPSYPVLTRRGLLWIKGGVLPRSDNGIYLAHGKQVERIASENTHAAVTSPNGCRLAYTTTRVDLFGKITEPTLKVIDLCRSKQ